MTAGVYTTAVGYQAGFSNTASYGVFLGRAAGYANTTGIYNIAIGSPAMYSNTTGSSNVAVGDSSLYYNTTGGSNTALGASALQSTTTSNYNTAVGYQAGYNANRTADTSGFNTLFGFQAGLNISTGQVNTFIGSRTGSAGANRITGGANTVVGDFAGNFLEGVASDNSFFGQNAGYAITTGRKNVLIGGYGGNSGGLDIRTSSNNIVLSDGDGNIRMYAPSDNFVRFGTRGNTTAAPGISSIYNSYTNLGTTPQTVDVVGGNASILHFFMQNSQADPDQASWTIWAGRDGGTAHRYYTVGGGGNCSISETSEGVFSITGLGDGVTYTLTASTSNFSWTFAASSTRTGTTQLSILVMYAAF